MTRNDIFSLMRDYACEELHRFSANQQGLSEKQDEAEKRQQDIFHRIVDKIKSKQGVVLDDAKIEQIGSMVYSRLWKAAGYTDPNMMNHFLSPAMAMQAVMTTLEEIRDNEKDESTEETISSIEPIRGATDLTSDLAWAITRLKRIAMSGDTYDQCHACETLVRCVKMLAEVGND